MADLESFRSEVRAWIEANAPASLRGRALDPTSVTWGGRRAQVHPDQRRWLDLMGERGWTAPTWPREYGGGGLSPAEAAVVQQEVARLKLPTPLAGMGLSMIGPTLLQHGNEEQKREHLPKIVRGEVRWCQGYSEPGAGSDLAALQTSAVRDGDAYVVNGQKIWTSGANSADWMFMLVRTDRASKHQGISFLLLDMTTPGIEVRPIKLISGSSPFCETFFTDVRVPVKNLVGRENEGWTIGKALLGFERSGIGGMGGASGGGPVRAEGRGGPQIAELARRYVGDAGGKVADPILRDRMAQLGMDQQCFQLTVQRAADHRKKGHAPGSETSMFKLYSTELGQRRDELLLAIRGPRALGWESGSGFADDEIAHTRGWLGARATTIYGGTSEIQLNIIAKRVLGLPDDPGT
jgi:alkylation response protein AidB-like acyl-CoA dehydrogenase